MLHIGATYPAAFLFGIVTAIQILAWRNIWGVIVTHGTFNLVVVIDQVCLNNYWILGNIDWGFGAPLQISITVLVVAIFGVYGLLNAPKVWAASR